MKVFVALGSFAFGNFCRVRDGDLQLADNPVLIAVRRRGCWPCRYCVAEAPGTVDYSNRTYLTAALLELSRHMRASFFGGQHTIKLEWSFQETVGSAVLWDRYLAFRAIRDIADRWGAETVVQEDGARYTLAAPGAFMSWHITKEGVAIALTTRRPGTLSVPLEQLHMIFDGSYHRPESD